MYQCNCGELFNSPEERTVHMTSCPVMADEKLCARCGKKRNDQVNSDICGSCADDLRIEDVEFRQQLKPALEEWLNNEMRPG